MTKKRKKLDKTDWSYLMDCKKNLESTMESKTNLECSEDNRPLKKIRYDR